MEELIISETQNDRNDLFSSKSRYLWASKLITIKRRTHETPVDQVNAFDLQSNESDNDDEQDELAL